MRSEILNYNYTNLESLFFASAERRLFLLNDIFPFRTFLFETTRKKRGLTKFYYCLFTTDYFPFQFVIVRPMPMVAKLLTNSPETAMRSPSASVSCGDHSPST